MHYHYIVSGRLVFRLALSTVPFERHLFLKRFRRLAVCDMRIEAMWDDGKWSEGSWHASGGGLGWMGSRGADKLTFFRCGRE
jgi:hypothetical protein